MRFPALLAVALAAAVAAPVHAVTPNTALRELAGLSPEHRAKVVSQLSEEEVHQLELLSEPLMDFIPRVSPTYTRPTHLAPLVELLQAATETPQNVVVHAPPRHTKTETILHAIAQLTAKESWRTSAYATYAADLAHGKSRKARDYARKAGVELREDASATREWRTSDGGGLLATGVMGPLTGQGVNGLLVVDDPIKNRVEAESATYRERVWDWFNDVAFTRREPGASVIVVMTRWHPDDLAGRLVREKHWRYLKLAAIDEEGKALWPARYPLEELAKTREQLGEYGFASLYQGMPRPRGGAVFGDVRFYDRAPTNGYRVAKGIDLAYSAKTHADYSVQLDLAECDGLFYVLEVDRQQVQAPAFGARIASSQNGRAKPRTRWYFAGPELGVAQLLTAAGVENLHALPAKADKFVRAQPVAAAWNAGKVLVPRDAPWVEKFVNEVIDFTGVDDQNDDQVDALAAAYDELNEATATYEGLELRSISPRRV